MYIGAVHANLGPWRAHSGVVYRIGFRQKSIPEGHGFDPHCALAFFWGGGNIGIYETTYSCALFTQAPRTWQAPEGSVHRGQ